jgi:glycosyltransferase involved in cell wall biosynthesis
MTRIEKGLGRNGMSNTLHVLGVAHTIPHQDYLVCAFTAKVLLFPEVIQPFGWDVIEYSNEGSASKAREHVAILTNDRFRALSQRRSREEPLDADVGNVELRTEFQRVLLEKIRSRAKPGDIVCHIWGPNMEVYNLLRDCHHIELCVGYTASPGLPFRVYESSAWMHWHYGKAGQEDGDHYKWVIPSPIDADIWAFNEKPDDYAVFLGRVTQRKGMNTLLEIARRMPELAIHVYGAGDPS